jgi:hypothetical protein
MMPGRPWKRRKLKSLQSKVKNLIRDVGSDTFFYFD